ncbi:MAG: metalloprotease PmbA, partial [Gammaproteobacteria bacterium]|nr:metalloprotease PmbA [Gammaproteobacteria bacterium]
MSSKAQSKLPRKLPGKALNKKQGDYEACIELALKAAKKFGAHEAAVAASQANGLSVTVRQNEIDTLEHHQDKGLNITVYVDQCKGSASTSDFSDKAIKEAVKVAVDIARFTSKDTFSGLPLAEDLAWDYPSLDLYHPWGISAEDAVELALECESAALKYDKRITNSEG